MGAAGVRLWRTLVRIFPYVWHLGKRDWSATLRWEEVVLASMSRKKSWFATR